VWITGCCAGTEAGPEHVYGERRGWRTDIPQEEAVEAMREKYEVCCGLFHGFDCPAWRSDSPTEGWRYYPTHRSTFSAERRPRTVREGSHRSLDCIRSCGTTTKRRSRFATMWDSSQAVRAILHEGSISQQSRPEHEVESRHPADHLQGGRIRSGCRHFRRGRAQEAPGTSQSCRNEFLFRGQPPPAKESLPSNCCANWLNDEIKNPLPP